MSKDGVKNGSVVGCVSVSIYKSVEEGVSECLHIHFRPELPQHYLAVLERHDLFNFLPDLFSLRVLFPLQQLDQRSQPRPVEENPAGPHHHQLAEQLQLGQIIRGKGGTARQFAEVMRNHDIKVGALQQLAL